MSDRAVRRQFVDLDATELVIGRVLRPVAFEPLDDLGLCQGTVSLPSIVSENMLIGIAECIASATPIPGGTSSRCVGASRSCAKLRHSMLSRRCMWRIECQAEKSASALTAGGSTRPGNTRPRRARGAPTSSSSTVDRSPGLLKRSRPPGLASNDFGPPTIDDELHEARTHESFANGTVECRGEPTLGAT